MTKNNGRCESLMCKYTGNVNEISGGFLPKSVYSLWNRFRRFFFYEKEETR